MKPIKDIINELRDIIEYVGKIEPQTEEIADMRLKLWRVVEDLMEK